MSEAGRDAWLDTLERSGTPGTARGATTEERQLREAISAVQRLLLDPELDPGERTRRLGELDRLERQDAEAQRRRRVAGGGGSTRDRMSQVRSNSRLKGPCWSRLSSGYLS